MDDKDSQDNRIIEIYQAESTNMLALEAESQFSDDHTLWAWSRMIGNQNLTETILSADSFPGILKLFKVRPGSLFCPQAVCVSNSSNAVCRLLDSLLATAMARARRLPTKMASFLALVSPV